MQKNLFRSLTKKFFIFLNLLTAILFLTGCYVSFFDPAKWWFLSLLTLASFYFLVILFIFFIFWIFLKSKWALIFIACVALTWKPIQKIIPFRLPSSFIAKKDPGAIRVMDWNVAQFEILVYEKSPEIKHQMLELINKYQPDIACFQEMVCGDSTIPAIYHLKDFADTLQFPYHSYVYNYKEDFVPDIHFGIIIFSKYPIINKKTLSFSPHDYNSIFQYADIVKGKDTIRIFNVHLQSLKFSRDNLHYIDSPTLETEMDVEKSRSVISKLKTGFLKHHIQADRIRAEIDKSPYPFIVCGDFNDVANSYATETVGENLQNAFVEKGHGLSRTFTGIAPTLRIDNIFTDKHFSILQYTRIRKKLSDHFPVVADIKSNAQQ